jgi:hypothetical protein
VIVVFQKGPDNHDKIEFLSQYVSDEMIPIVSSNAVIKEMAVMIPVIDTIIACYAVLRDRGF